MNRFLTFTTGGCGSTYCIVSIAHLLEIPHLGAAFLPMYPEGYLTLDDNNSIGCDPSIKNINNQYNVTYDENQNRIKLDRLSKATNGYILKINEGGYSSLPKKEFDTYLQIQKPTRILLVREDIEDLILSRIFTHSTDIYALQIGEQYPTVKLQPDDSFIRSTTRNVAIQVKFLQNLYKKGEYDILLKYEDFIGDPNVDFKFVESTKVIKPYYKKMLTIEQKKERLVNFEHTLSLLREELHQCDVGSKFNFTM